MCHFKAHDLAQWGMTVKTVILSDFKFSELNNYKYLYHHSCMLISEFPIGNTAITVGLMVKPKPGNMLLFRFVGPRDQEK
jgi:hypothetical protein